MSRNTYVTKRYVRERLKTILSLCSNERLKHFIKMRALDIKRMKTKEGRKYLYFDIIEILQNPYRWRDEKEEGKGIVMSEPRTFT